MRKLCFIIMIGKLAALIFFSITSLIQTVEVPQQILLTVVEVGENVTLRCPVSDKEGKFFCWYKQPLGYMMQIIASGTFNKQKLSEQFNNGRFKLTEGTSEYILTIRNVSKDDEATYFCQNGTAYFQSFAGGIYLAVNDHKKFTHIRQTPKTLSVQEGNKVTIECSLLFKSQEINTHQCPNENNVYWFRIGTRESHPTFIYSHKNSSDTPEKRSCVYRLSKTVQKPSDTGMYYCAVVTIGEILLGEGTNVKTTPHFKIEILILAILLACSVTIIITLIVYINQRVNKVSPRGARHPRRDQTRRNHDEQDVDGVNYVALNFSARKLKGMKKRKETPECVYTYVRADNKTLHDIS